MTLSRAALLALSFMLPASVVCQASIINFEDQPAGPDNFAAAGPAQTLIYSVGGVMATFTGGVILTNETSQSTDFTNVYATASFGDASLTNPLVVTFDQPIVNFQIDILNALAGDYTMSDNAGHSLNFSLATTGGSLATEGFAATGTTVQILYNGPGLGGTTFDFAIDNVLFNQPLTGVPEPGTLALVGFALAGIGLCRRARARS